MDSHSSNGRCPKCGEAYSPSPVHACFGATKSKVRVGQLIDYWTAKAQSHERWPEGQGQDAEALARIYVDTIDTLRAALEPRGLRQIGVKHQADRTEYIWWETPPEGTPIYVAAEPPKALLLIAERIRDHACSYGAPADSVLVKRELIGQLAQVLGGSISVAPCVHPWERVARWSDSGKGIRGETCSLCDKELDREPIAAQPPRATRCYCGAHAWPADCVQIEDSRGRLHTERGCQPGATLTKEATTSSGTAPAPVSGNAEAGHPVETSVAADSRNASLTTEQVCDGYSFPNNPPPRCRKCGGFVRPGLLGAMLCGSCGESQ